MDEEPVPAGRIRGRELARRRAFLFVGLVVLANDLTVVVVGRSLRSV